MYLWTASECTMKKGTHRSGSVVPRPPIYRASSVRSSCLLTEWESKEEKEQVLEILEIRSRRALGLTEGRGVRIEGGYSRSRGRGEIWARIESHGTPHRDVFSSMRSATAPDFVVRMMLTDMQARVASSRHMEEKQEGRGIQQREEWLEDWSE